MLQMIVDVLMNLRIHEVTQLFLGLPQDFRRVAYCCFFFKRGYGLCMMSFRYFGQVDALNVPQQSARFARLFQLKLNSNLHGACLSSDGSYLVSLGINYFNQHEIRENEAVTVLDIVDPLNVPQSFINYIPRPFALDVISQWFQGQLPFGKTLHQLAQMLKTPFIQTQQQSRTIE
ncbi:hypothetical protein THRCLA_09835 [Thraustotheca clavata]|uniref:Uncharacterized protein n=1 Tax=Thraustotheca clavata TaxID=74557 RepID=A0A1V9YU94_9STRA|nr:hypothetical protein THRCLA_09835 [Thraustotheca clavata]